MIYTTGSIVRVIVADSGEWAVGVITRIMGDTVVVACSLQVSGGRIVYSREVVGEVVEVLAGPDDPTPSGAVTLTPVPVLGGTSFNGVATPVLVGSFTAKGPPEITLTPGASLSIGGDYGVSTAEQEMLESLPPFVDEVLEGQDA